MQQARYNYLTGPAFTLDQNREIAICNHFQFRAQRHHRFGVPENDRLVGQHIHKRSVLQICGQV
jgi:hypothetical protein